MEKSSVIREVEVPFRLLKTNGTEFRYKKGFFCWLTVREFSEYFDAFENELEKNLNEPHWLKNDAVAAIVIDSLLFNNNKHYTLLCACLMSNHVHILLTTLPGSALLNVLLQNHKKFTAVHSNKVLKRSGTFWAEESYDTIIRNDTHFFRTVNYIIQDPVTAGLVKKWSDWKWTYIHPELEEGYKLQSRE